MLVPPAELLAIASGVTAGAMIAASVDARRRRAALARLAADLHMTYCHDDALRLAAKLPALFPVPGVAQVRVSDLLYVAGPAAYRYLFTVEYTTGAVRARKRRRCAVALIEPRRAPAGAGTGRTADQSQPPPDEELHLWPAGGRVEQQYRGLADWLATR